MDVQQAVKKAKDQIVLLFTTEGADSIGLEEVDRDEVTHDWLVTIGFSRPWDKPGNVIAAISGPVRRVYKVVRIKENTEEVISVKDRDLART